MAKGLSLLNADSGDSDQTGWMPNLIGVFAGFKTQIVRFVTRQLIFFSKAQTIFLNIAISLEAVKQQNKNAEDHSSAYLMIFER